MKALRTTVAVLLAALTAMTFVACDEDEDDDPTTGSLWIAAYVAGSLDVVYNASVTVSGETQSTGTEGYTVFSNLPAGEKTITVSHADYLEWTGTRTVIADSVLTVIAPLVGVGTSNFTVTVRDALTSDLLEGASVMLDDVTEVTDASGMAYFSEIAAGYYDLTISMTDYLSFEYESYPVLPGNNEYTAAISPIEVEGVDAQYRFVLTWGETPRDLDSHVLTPEIEGNVYHVYFSNRGSLDAIPWVYLDVDDTSSYGPETVTVTQMVSGTYEYYIYNWSGEASLVGCGATVAIYRDNLYLQTVTIPYEGDTEHDYWHVASFNSSGQLTVHNEIQETAPGTLEWAPENEPLTPAKMR